MRDALFDAASRGDALHDILLRLPHKGGRRGRLMFAARFQAFESGEYSKLVTWYLQDRARQESRPRSRRRQTEAVEEAKAIVKALDFIAAGEISRAVRLLDSNGLADVSDPAVVAQLEAKHPARKQPLPPLPNGGAPTPRPLDVRLRGVYGRLRRKCAPGPDNMRNEYLITLDREYDNAQASDAIRQHEALATLFVNGQLPTWYYAVQSASLIVASIKNDPGGGATPDVRPIAMGNAAPRAWAKSVAAEAKDLFRRKLEPVQVAVGMPGGLGVMIFGSRLMSELRPDFVAIRIDKKNAYNELSRAAALRALETDPDLAVFAPYFHAVYSPLGPIFLGGERAPFDSAEGGRQGDPFYCAVYSWATHAANLVLAKEMEALGGAAFFDVDDGIVIGPIHEAFAAVRRYEIAIAALGEELRPDKCASYSPQYGAALSAQPGYDASFPVSAEGLEIGGVPVGTNEYVAAALRVKEDEVLGKIKKISNKLHDVHLQSLSIVIYSSLQHMTEYWAQHSYPADSAAMLEAVDAGITEATTAAYGGSFVADDPLLERRMRLPARLRGAGVRRTAQVANAAFVGAASAALPWLIDVQTAGGATRRGAVQALDAWLGVGSFDPPNAASRFRALRASPSRLGGELEAAWGGMQRERGATAQPAADGLLDRPFEAAGTTTDGSVVPRLQRALTLEREEALEGALDAEMCALDVEDVRRTAWLSVDEYSATLFTALPSRFQRFRNDDWREAVATVFGAPSPACADCVGSPIETKGKEIGRLDARGDSLLTLPSLQNVGNCRVHWHDDLKHRLATMLREAQVDHVCEVYGIFAAEMPQAARSLFRRACQLRTTRQGLVPDMMWRYMGYDMLGDVKTMTHCKTRYNPAALRDGVRGKAVAARALKVHHEYTRAARMLDAKYCATLPGQVGPVSTKLLSYGQIRGLVFGAFGEVSAGVRELVEIAAKAGALRHYRSMGASSVNQAASALKGRYRRELGLAALREQVHLKLKHLDLYVKGSTGGFGGAATEAHEQDGWHKARTDAYTESQGFCGRAAWTKTRGGA